MLKLYLPTLLLLLGAGQLRAQDVGVSGLGAASIEAVEPRLEGFEWEAAFVDTSVFLGIEHGFRVINSPKIRQGLRGPFFRDYVNSVRNIGGWSDGDNMITNYIGHPFAGSLVGYIQVRHDPRYRAAEFGETSQYWKSRMRAMGFTAAYSLAFEIGPISQASIGNIQLGPRKRGVVDWVVTPTVGTAWMVTEDVIDKYLVRALERRTGNRAFLAIARTALNPSRTLSNLVGRRLPWQRDDRPGLNSLASKP